MPDDGSLAKSPADRGYTICANGRSGSNLLCQYLSSTGLLGHPLEFFNPDGQWRRAYPGLRDNPGRPIHHVLTVGATANGIYGLKVMAVQIDRIAKHVPWTQMLPNLSFVRMKRVDLLGQAISSLRAVQTNQWRSTMKANGSAVYDGAAIYKHLCGGARNSARWDVFFARNQIEPVVITYEELLVDPQSSIDKVAALFGLQGQTPIRKEKVDLGIQRDALTEVWRARFRDEFRNLDEVDLV